MPRSTKSTLKMSSVRADRKVGVKGDRAAKADQRLVTLGDVDGHRHVDGTAAAGARASLPACRLRPPPPRPQAHPRTPPAGAQRRRDDDQAPALATPTAQRRKTARAKPSRRPRVVSEIGRRRSSMARGPGSVIARLQLRARGQIPPRRGAKSQPALEVTPHVRGILSAIRCWNRAHILALTRSFALSVPAEWAWSTWRVTGISAATPRSRCCCPS